MSDLNKNILNKLYVVAVLMVVFFLFIVFRIVDIQYIDGDKYRKLVEKTIIKNDTVIANKGNVYASDGNLLSTSMSKFTIRMDVMTVDDKVFEENIVKLSRELANLLGGTSHSYYNKIRNAKKERNRYLLIARNVGYNDYVKMKSFPIFNLGLYGGGFIAEHKTVRSHPIGKIASRTIGYDDHRGGSGIEGAFSNYIEGKNGRRLKQKIAKGEWKPINDVNEQEPIDGKDVITTIDVNIQDITHYSLLNQLKKFDADHGCAIVMEVETGEVRAISNLGRAKDGNYYELYNYAVGERHEPGSTFKLASLMVGLEDKVIDTSTIVDCEKGRIYIHRKKVEDSRRGGHGRITMAEVIEKSSNIGVVKVIREFYDKNPKKFTDKILSFGLGDKAGVKLKGETTPYIPQPTDKGWSKISLSWMAWGYGVSLTPLQLLTFYNAIANDGKIVKPRFVKEIRTGDKIVKKYDRQVLRDRIASTETLDKVREVLKNVVKRGTATNIYSPNFSMAGKTGTARKYVTYKDSKGKIIGGGYPSGRYIASFAGFFPAEKPKYSCVVVIHDPDVKKGYYGATVAAPAFKEIAHKIHTVTPSDINKVSSTIKKDELRKDYDAYFDNLKRYKNIMPNVVGMSAMDAVSLLENVGLKVKFNGVGKVKEQSIRRGEKISKGAVVYLKLR